MLPSHIVAYLPLFRSRSSFRTWVPHDTHPKQYTDSWVVLLHIWCEVDLADDCDSGMFNHVDHMPNVISTPMPKPSDVIPNDESHVIRSYIMASYMQSGGLWGVAPLDHLLENGFFQIHCPFSILILRE